MFLFDDRVSETLIYPGAISYTERSKFGQNYDINGKSFFDYLKEYAKACPIMPENGPIRGIVFPYEFPLEQVYPDFYSRAEASGLELKTIS